MSVLKDSQATVVVGLGTYTHTCANTGIYNIAVQSSEIPTSSLAISIAQTGSVSHSVSSVAPTDQQSTLNLQTRFQCAAGDLITIVLSSSAGIDKQLNNVKTIIAMGRVQ